MKCVTLLVIPSLVAANSFFPRQEAQPTDDANKILTLRANFCLNHTNQDCQSAIIKCQDEYEIIEDCIRDKHPSCIQDEESPCSKAVLRCHADFGKEPDADQAVKDCIVEKMISGLASHGDEEDNSPKTDNQQTAPASLARPEKVAACKKVGSDYVEAFFKDNCDERDSSVCEKAGVAFDQAWTANNCEAVIDTKE